MEKTTSADRLEDIFLKFHATLSEANKTGHSTLVSWRNALNGGNTVSDNDIVIKIIEINEELNELSQQISNSKMMKDSHKQFAYAAIEIFIPATNISNIHSRAMDISRGISVITCGQIGVIGRNIFLEYSENTIPKDAIPEIISELEDILSSLEDNALPFKIQVRLKKQLNAIIWRLRNPSITSLQEAYEAIAKITIVANEMDRLSNPSEQGNETPKFAERLVPIFQRLQGYVETGHKIYTTAEKLSEVVKPLLSS